MANNLDIETRAALRHLIKAGIVIAIAIGLTYTVKPFAEFRPVNQVNLNEQLPWKVPDKSKSGYSLEISDYTLPRLQPSYQSKKPSIPDSLFLGLPQTIIDDKKSLASFYDQLAQLLSSDEFRHINIGFWGDSHVAEGTFVEAFRKYMQELFGNGGYGFIPIKRPYGRIEQELYWKADDKWTSYLLTSAGRSDGLYGYAGVVSEAKGWAKVSYKAKYETDSTIAGKLELWYYEHPKGGKISIEHDDIVYEIDAKADIAKEVVYSDSLSDYRGRVVIRSKGGGENIIFGTVIESATKGIVVDNLGILGMRSNRLLNIDPEHFKDQLANRELSLGLLMFGGNEMGNKDGVDTLKFYLEYCQVIDLMRTAAPDLPLVLLTPIDHGYKKGGKVISHPDIIKVVNTVRKVAKDKQVALYDLWQAMGGQNSMGKWQNNKPKLGWSDNVHLTPLGYELISRYLFMALLEGYSND